LPHVARQAFRLPPFACDSDPPRDASQECQMAPHQTSMRTNARPRGKTPAERAEEATAVQRRLKQEAAERRRAAAAAPQRHVANPAAARRRRTP
jgi:hypothetical protein